MARQMENSGVEWIGTIPSEWEIRRNKTLFDCSKEIVGKASKETQLLSLTTQGIKTKSRDATGGKVPESFDTYQTVMPDDIVMCLFDLDCSAVFSGISPYYGMISPAYKIIKCKSGLLPKYADYWFKFVFDGRKFKSYAKNLRYTLNYDEFAVLPFALPNLSEQEKIVSYLDKKCAEIDTVIAKTKATIEEYKKLKQAIVIDAVTKGIRGNRPMIDSGIEWIGDIPAHWEIRKGKWILSRLERPVKDDDGVITCFRDGEVTLRSKRREDGFTFSLQEVGYQGIEPGDLVVHGMDGFAGAIGISDSRGKGTPVLNVLDSNQDKRYVMYYLRNMAYNGIFLALATGIRVRSCDTNWNKLKELSYLLPPIEEQKQIADYLDKKCAEIDTLIEKKTALLAEMETYKKSVIYEYVTGKKEVL